MVLVIGSFCRYMLSIYEYIRYDTFGQCFIALTFANHKVSKAQDWHSEANLRDPLDLLETIRIHQKH